MTVIFAHGVKGQTCLLIAVTASTASLSILMKPVDIATTTKDGQIDTAVAQIGGKDMDYKKGDRVLITATVIRDPKTNDKMLECRTEGGATVWVHLEEVEEADEL